MTTVFAPGKLVLSGAYAVLEGAPAIVVATSRGAIADTSRVALTPTPEVRAAIGDRSAPHVDASSMFVGSRKLGLGASAAILVASIGALEAEAGIDLASPDVRAGIFARARAAHAEAQDGGSGVDVASAVYGGVLRYVIDDPSPVTLPAGANVFAFACGTSARTSALRAEVDRLADANPTLHAACFADLTAIAMAAADAVGAGDGSGFIAAIRRAARALARLGEAADVPIVPPGFARLEELAAEFDSAFCVAGAGGGDVAVLVGPRAPTPTFLERAHALGLFPLELDLDEKGVRTTSRAKAATGAAREARSPNDR